MNVGIIWKNNIVSITGRSTTPQHSYSVRLSVDAHLVIIVEFQSIFTIGFELVKPLLLYIIWFPILPLRAKRYHSLDHRQAISVLKKQTLISRPTEKFPTPQPPFRSASLDLRVDGFLTTVDVERLVLIG
jgi:hypothetical protein